MQYESGKYPGSGYDGAFATTFRTCHDRLGTESTCRARKKAPLPEKKRGQRTIAVRSRLADARQLLARHDRFILVCGHYEGIDERFIEECVDEEISIGDFVLTGGEIPAMAVADAVCRLVPGVLSDAECYTEESHFSGMLEYPQYTRPAVWHKRPVPEVLLSGHHANITDWRRAQALSRTRAKRPDMFSVLELSQKDQRLLADLEQE